MVIIKKILSILLLLVFLFNTTGYYFVFKLNQEIIHSSMKTKINSGFCKETAVIITIDLNVSNPSFIKVGDDEISYCGRLYDVASETVIGRIAYYHCVLDDQEENLIACFEKLKTLPFTLGSTEKTKQVQVLIHNIVTAALIVEPLNPAGLNPVDASFLQYFKYPAKAVLMPFPPPPEFS